MAYSFVARTILGELCKGFKVRFFNALGSGNSIVIVATVILVKKECILTK